MVAGGVDEVGAGGDVCGHPGRVQVLHAHLHTIIVSFYLFRDMKCDTKRDYD